MATTPMRDGPPPAVTDEALATRHDDARFLDLKRSLFRFVIPATLAFLAWYLLYVLLSAFARDFMGTVVFGNVNVALLLGLGQFVSTFGIAWAYSRYASRRFDPAAESLRAEIENGDAE
jgi:uncharacterized membrane protein (DUF485 family)